MNAKTQSPLKVVVETSDTPTLPSADQIKHYVKQNASAFGRLTKGRFEFTNHTQAEHLSAMLALNTPFPEKASMGIWELLSNAVEHGNLGIDMDLKGQLLTDGKLLEEVERRHTVKPYSDRVAIADFETFPDRIVLKVTDQGDGFDFERALEGELPLDRPNGRGIKLASMVSFDELNYSGNGNHVEAVFRIAD